MQRNKEIIDVFKKYLKRQSLYTSDNKVIIDSLEVDQVKLNPKCDMPSNYS